MGYHMLFENPLGSAKSEVMIRKRGTTILLCLGDSWWLRAQGVFMNPHSTIFKSKNSSSPLLIVLYFPPTTVTVILGA